MKKLTLKGIMNHGHQIANIEMSNGRADVYVIALSYGLKKAWAEYKERSRLAAIKAKREAAKAAKSEARNEPTVRSNWTTRRVVLLAEAIDNGLNHGKSWICGDVDIETKGAMPAYEGEQICYAYA